MCMPMSTRGMTTQTLTTAELALHLGFVLPQGAHRNAMEIETLVETSWHDIPRVRYAHEHLAGAPDAHTYALLDAQDAEDAYWGEVPLDHHTKYALSRRLERLHGWDRARLWKCKWNDLRTAMDSGVRPW